MTYNSHLKRLAIVGNAGGTNIGDSLLTRRYRPRASTSLFNSLEASCGTTNSSCSRLAHRSSASKTKLIFNQSHRSVPTSSARRTRRNRCSPLDGFGVARTSGLGRGHRKLFHRRSMEPGNAVELAPPRIALVRVVFTTRRSNLSDFQRSAVGTRTIFRSAMTKVYLRRRKLRQYARPRSPFCWWRGPRPRSLRSEFMRYGPPVALAGGYWERYAALRPFALGKKPPEVIRALTAAAKVNLCLVRRANRDGHVMRSFEIAATGGCMLAEDTEEHREIFGSEGDAVVYFRDPKEAAQRARALLSDPSERERLASCLHRRIVGGANTYTHRLLAILKEAMTIAKVCECKQ